MIEDFYRHCYIVVLVKQWSYLTNNTDAIGHLGCLSFPVWFSKTHSKRNMLLRYALVLQNSPSNESVIVRA